MSIGILTSGGDCPGLNAVIRGAVLKGIKVYDKEFVGFKDGWRGVVQGDIMPLERKDIQGIAKQGGTILGTSRTNPFEGDGGAERVRENMDRLGIESLIAIGGEGTLAAAKRLTDAGIKIVRRAIQAPLRQIAENAGVDGSVVVGKVIENDSRSFGFDAQAEEYGDMLKAGVIDPTKVVRIALENAASIAGLLITTEAMVAQKLEKASADSEMSDMGGMM